MRGVYNRGWLIGDERAITATAQAELDGMLEIAPQGAPGVPRAAQSTEAHRMSEPA